MKTMVFSSSVFLFVFLPIVLLVYYLVNGELKNYWLLFASLFFYGWNQPQFLWIILFCICINYIGGLLISRMDQQDRKGLKKCCLVLTIVLNLCCLFYFKYFNLMVHTIRRLSGLSFSFTEILLPIGISFFTFQSMSYIIDVYRNRVRVQKNFMKLALYVVLFPQLVAGPIVRYSDVENEINYRKSSFEDLYYGIRRFILGLAKKTIIANTMAVTADKIFNGSPYEHTVPIAWLGILCYTIQIYFDFSGYSDMAIGLGKMLGFHFPENFDMPYIAKSITEFWRRWHISLSSWFRDYVYIPLGGNRKHVYINLAIVFILTGIWHGAAYQFVFWGIFHGFFIVLERYLTNHVKCINTKSVMVRIVQHSYTLLLVMIGWVFFRASGMIYGVKYVLSMFGLLKDIVPRFDVRWYLDRYTVVILIIGIICSTPIINMMYCKLMEKTRDTVRVLLVNSILFLLLVYSLSCIVMSTYNPFIYFQF